MEQRQLSVSIIQAINRIRCRHVIDAEGDCPTANIFIVMPDDHTADTILDDIRSEYAKELCLVHFSANAQSVPHADGLGSGPV